MYRVIVMNVWCVVYFAVRAEGRRCPGTAMRFVGELGEVCVCVCVVLKCLCLQAKRRRGSEYYRQASSSPRVGAFTTYVVRVVRRRLSCVTGSRFDGRRGFASPVTLLLPTVSV